MIAKDETRTISINRAGLLTLIAGAFALGIFVGAATGLFTFLPAARSESAPEAAEGTFKFIRASAEAGSHAGKHPVRELKPFQYKVDMLIENARKGGGISAVSVYFRDLNNGNWFGIREHETLAPKSMLKVPLMIAYFKWAEANPLVLRKTLTYTAAERKEEEKAGGPAHRLEPGKAYSVNDLIFRMIAYDDAEAFALLAAHLPAGRLEKIYGDLMVEYNPQRQEAFLSMRELAAFYRVLYNASYLSEEMSEKALRYISKSTLRSGMAAGIPASVEVAAKQGERTVPPFADGEEGESRQLHEFGIVYHPNRPFLLGVMAQGTDTDRMAKVVRDLARLVYEEVDGQS